MCQKQEPRRTSSGTRVRCTLERLEIFTKSSWYRNIHFEKVRETVGKEGSEDERIERPVGGTSISSRGPYLTKPTVDFGSCHEEFEMTRIFGGPLKQF